MRIIKASFLFLSLIVLFSNSYAEVEQKTTIPEKPNILFLIADDMGWADIGYRGYGIKTPNLDRLAKEGVRLEQHYAMATCTPTRVGIMTGKYPSRYGITGPDYGEVIDMGDATLASVLKDEGYYTAISGKWHMGSPPYTPLKYGFQSSYGYFDGQIDPYTHYYKTKTETTDRESWHRNDEYISEKGHATDLITNEAIRVIESGKENPFFLYVAYSVPHTPLDEPERWTSLYDDNFYTHPSRKLYAASISHMDEGIGRIIKALKSTGQLENTVVIFISDNGGGTKWDSKTQYRGRYADKPQEVLGCNFPLRGMKGDLYEGGIRVPAFVNWPGVLDPGALHMPVHFTDWLPTICDISGYEVNQSVQDLDGESIWPFLTGEESPGNNHPMYWKTSDCYAVRDGNWKIVVFNDKDNVELFNLKDDFRELEDISDDHPEKLQHMLKLLEEFKSGDR